MNRPYSRTPLRWPAYAAPIIVFLSAVLLWSWWSTAGADEPAIGIGARGILRGHDAASVMLQTGFEDGEPELEHPDHERVRDRAHGGDFSMHARIAKENTAAFLRVPFEGAGGRRLRLSFWIFSPDRAKCALWVSMDGKGRAGRRIVGTHTELRPRWTRLEAHALPKTDAPGFFEIVAPSSHGAEPGEVWIDDVELAASKRTDFTLSHGESFPALATDGQGHIWLTVIARRALETEVRIYRIEGERRRLVSTLRPQKASGYGAPAVTALEDGLIVVTPVEQGERWRLAWVRVDSRSEGNLTCHYLDAGGNSNRSPALAIHCDGACVVWESNGEGTHGIYASFLVGGEASPPRRLSSTEHASANPDVVALADGRLFSAWDSCRDDSVDLYGAHRVDGIWTPERRLTSDPRLERHVALAARGNEVWLAWQAQSFRNHSLNLLREQRIVVARWTGDELRSLPGVFEKVSPPGALLLRPRIALDGAGRLWLTARQSMGQHEGWQPVVWSHSGGSWSGSRLLWPDQGRWSPVPITFSPSGGLAAFQRDDLPRFWNIQVGENEDWHSEVLVVPLPGADGPSVVSLETEPLRMPETDFRLSAHRDGFSLDLPRQSVEFGGRRLELYWGDLHNHTDLSVCQRAGNPPIPDLYANQRDIERLDFTAITDHGYNIDHPQWAYTAEQVRAFFDPGHFVTLLGEEWTSDHVHYEPRRSYRRYGHRNLIFRDTRFPRFFDSRDGDVTPRELWNQLEGVEHITIPHQLADTGNCPTDWTFHDERFQPLAEIFQARESYEYYKAPRQAGRATPFRGHFLQDAWALGIVIGVIASPDHGGGKGKAGVWCDRLARDALFEAFHARHTFGTSGAKISLFVSSGEHMMGDKVLRPGTDAIPFHIRAVTARPLSRVVILRSNRIVEEIDTGDRQVDLTWTDPEPLQASVAWYYVRLHREDGELAWSSPIWFFRTRRALEATVEHAHELPARYPEGVPVREP